MPESSVFASRNSILITLLVILALSWCCTHQYIIKLKKNTIGLNLLTLLPSCLGSLLDNLLVKGSILLHFLIFQLNS